MALGMSSRVKRSKNALAAPSLAAQDRHSMTAPIQHRTTTGPRFGGSRFFASPPCAPRRQKARPEKRVAGRKTAPGIFFAPVPERHLEVATQSLGTHQENSICYYGIVSGCAVAPDSAGTTGPATWGTVLGMFGQWLTGTAPANQMFGPNTPQTQGMMNAPGVQNALNYFYAKNVGNGPDQQQPVVDYGVGFGLSGLVAAGNSPIQQFVGNYRVDLYPNADGNISVQLTNTTSMTSFLYGLWPNSWNPSAGYPGGNYTQHYDWTVPNQNVPNPSRPPGSGASGSW
jgi:hypothetical protein